MGSPPGRAVTTMEFNGLAVGEDHLLGPSCQQHAITGKRAGETR